MDAGRMKPSCAAFVTLILEGDLVYELDLSGQRGSGTRFMVAFVATSMMTGSKIISKSMSGAEVWYS